MNRQEFINLFGALSVMSESPRFARNNAALRSQIYAQAGRGLVLDVLNAGTNTIDDSLKRHAIAQLLVEDFARRVLVLKAFATVFKDVPLEGTNKVQVPFYDLDTGASTSFTYANGYVAGDTATDNREIQIGKRAAADVADDTKTYDRKYQALAFSSEDLARQPALKIYELAKLKVDKLASDIIAHILSCVTAANYGAAAVTQPASMFDSDDVADIKEACKLWPEMGRSLILDSAYDANLLKDPSIKGSLNFGGNEAIRQGRIPQIMGFDYYEIPTLPTNGENLKGMAVFQSAILCAFAPVPPAPAVLRAGTEYEMAIHEPSGVVLEFRRFGISQSDSAVNVAESSYGFTKGTGTALKRIVSG